jgi:hypothetical protein
MFRASFYYGPGVCIYFILLLFISRDLIDQCFLSMLIFIYSDLYWTHIRQDVSSINISPEFSTETPKQLQQVENSNVKKKLSILKLKTIASAAVRRRLNSRQSIFTPTSRGTGFGQHPSSISGAKMSFHRAVARAKNLNNFKNHLSHAAYPYDPREKKSRPSVTKVDILPIIEADANQKSETENNDKADLLHHSRTMNDAKPKPTDLAAKRGVRRTKRFNSFYEDRAFEKFSVKESEEGKENNPNVVSLNDAQNLTFRQKAQEVIDNYSNPLEAESFNPGDSPVLSVINNGDPNNEDRFHLMQISPTHNERGAIVMGRRSSQRYNSLGQGGQGPKDVNILGSTREHVIPPIEAYSRQPPFAIKLEKQNSDSIDSPSADFRPKKPIKSAFKSSKTTNKILPLLSLGSDQPDSLESPQKPAPNHSLNFKGLFGQNNNPSQQEQSLKPIKSSLLTVHHKSDQEDDDASGSKRSIGKSRRDEKYMKKSSSIVKHHGRSRRHMLDEGDRFHESKTKDLSTSKTNTSSPSRKYLLRQVSSQLYLEGLVDPLLQS